MEKLIENFKQTRLFQVFTIGLRYLIGAAFVFASIVKIEGQRFTSQSGQNEPIDTSWHYFETMYRSGIYWNFIGWGQLIAGFLLMSQRFSTLGAVAFFPIIANVFVITISYDFNGTPVITFLMLLGNIYLLLWDWDKFKVIVNPQTTRYIPNDMPFMQRKAWTILGIFYFGITILIKKGSSLPLLYQSINPALFLLICLVLSIGVGVFVLIIQLRNSK
jgi:hypothetical protein